MSPVTLEDIESLLALDTLSPEDRVLLEQNREALKAGVLLPWPIEVLPDFGFEAQDVKMPCLGVPASYLGSPGSYPGGKLCPGTTQALLSGIAPCTEPLRSRGSGNPLP